MKITMTTLANGRYVEEHEVNELEAGLWKTVVGLDLEHLATEGVEYKALTEPKEDLKGRTPEHARQDQEREALVRAMHAAEKATRRLPSSANGIAGFLFTQGIRGNDTSTGNPLAVYVKEAIKEALGGTSGPDFSPGDIQVYAESSGLIIETPRYQLCIDPHGASWPFLEGHRAGRYRELWAY